MHFSFIQNYFLDWYKSIFTNFNYNLKECYSLELDTPPSVVFCINEQKNLDILKEMKYRLNHITIGFGDKRNKVKSYLDFFFPFDLVTIYSLYWILSILACFLINNFLFNINKKNSILFIEHHWVNSIGSFFFWYKCKFITVNTFNIKKRILFKGNKNKWKKNKNKWKKNKNKWKKITYK